MTASPLVAALALTLSMPAVASPLAERWEPSADNIEARLAAVHKWQNEVLGPKPEKEQYQSLRQMISKLAARSTPPQWTTKGSWKQKQGATEIWYGVGVISGIKNAALALTTAENRARAEVGKMKSVSTEVVEDRGGRRVRTFSSNVMTGVVFADWFVAADGAVYVLAVKRWPDGSK